MDLQERLRSLKTIDLFQAFSEEELRRFATEVTEVHYAAGDLLFAEEESGQEMFILLEGALKISKNNRIITTIRPVDYVGEMALIEEKPRSATVMAVQPSRLLKISAHEFHNYLAEQPRSLVTLMKNLSERIRRDTELIAAEFEKTNILVHDMRNILSTFLFLDGLLHQPLEEPGQRAVRYMQAARKNLAQLMDEALAHAKRQHHPVPKQTDSLPALLQEMAETDFRTHPDLRDRPIPVEIDPAIPEFSFNRLEIRRVLLNLLLNAAQASRPAQRIELKAVRQEDQVVIQVKDQGAGIPEPLRERIFLPHFTTRPEGHGLGLASCRQIVEEKHGGTISFHSVAQQSTTFTVSLPLCRAGQP